MKSAQNDPVATSSYANFIRLQVPRELRSLAVPATKSGWDERLAKVRAGLKRSFGRTPESPCALEPEVLGTLVREGYAIERLTFQSRPGVRVTANLYRPDPVKHRYPGVLSVHGHWAWARMDPHVQPRCIALAKLGYVVLCVDAFGAGERAIEPGSGTYHGALVGASLWPLGTALLGLQVYDNRRAVDYLALRPEVDATKLAITGASGGGNQTLYAGATDERLSAVIPVCGIGTYESYLTAACCVCEVNVRGAAYATTGDLLAMIAPRALLVISATRDALQFSVREAARSIAQARVRYRLMGVEERIRHVSIDSGHDYNQPMREAMYGWVEKWLRGRGDGSPTPEPKLTVVDVKDLRCYPDAASRPKSIVTIPEFALREGRQRLAGMPRVADHRERWLADAERMRSVLRDQILGGFPPRAPLNAAVQQTPAGTGIAITTEPGIRSEAWIEPGPVKERGTAVILVPGQSARERDGTTSDRAHFDKMRPPWTMAGYRTLGIRQPRGTGSDLAGTQSVAGVADHTVAEWALWVGRPLLGQWVWDILRWLDLLDETRLERGKRFAGVPAAARPYVLVGSGATSLAAILAAAFDARVEGVTCSDCLVSFVASSAKAWSGVPMGLIVPDILDVGDVSQLAALVAPRPLVIKSGIDPDGARSAPEQLRRAFAYCRSVYDLFRAGEKLSLAVTGDGHPS